MHNTMNIKNSSVFSSTFALKIMQWKPILDSFKEDFLKIVMDKVFIRYLLKISSSVHKKKIFTTYVEICSEYLFITTHRTTPSKEKKTDKINTTLLYIYYFETIIYTFTSIGDNLHAVV